MQLDVVDVIVVQFPLGLLYRVSSIDDDDDDDDSEEIASFCFSSFASKCLTVYETAYFFDVLIKQMDSY